VGTQLRELQDEVQALSAQVAELEERLRVAERTGDPGS
jgi:prefoldin subunit 5